MHAGQPLQRRPVFAGARIEARQQRAHIPQQAGWLTGRVPDDDASSGIRGCGRDPGRTERGRIDGQRVRTIHDDRMLGAAASSSARVGNRRSRRRGGKVRGVQIQPPSGVVAARARTHACRLGMSWSETYGWNASPSATPSACTWLSIRPGTTVRPPARITRVRAPMNGVMSVSLPTATNTPSRTATAPAMRDEGSTVTTLPFRTTRSAGAWAYGSSGRAISSAGITQPRGARARGEGCERAPCCTRGMPRI